MIKKLLALCFCFSMLSGLISCTENPVGTSQTPETTPETQQIYKAFNTENILCIKFYSFYGEGMGSEVPESNMEEITNWLASYTIGETASEIVVPGCNTYHVEIEYSDGTIIKSGLDIISVEGVSYYTDHDPAPRCFDDIISKTTLEISYEQITQEEAKRIMDSKRRYIILDVRTQQEYDMEHIENAILIPDTEITEKAPSMLLHKNALILVYCRSGNRSKTASQALADMGYTNVKEFGGIIDWKYGTVK